MKSASSVASKFAERAAAASPDYVKGSQETNKDQAALAIAGKANWVAGLQNAQSKGLYEKGLQKSGKSGWLEGVTKKGADRFAGGVMTAAQKYAENSGRFDSARNAASGTPRGPKGAPQNLQRVAVVSTALRAAKGA